MKRDMVLPCAGFPCVEVCGNATGGALVDCAIYPQTNRQLLVLNREERDRFWSYTPPRRAAQFRYDVNGSARQWRHYFCGCRTIDQLKCACCGTRSEFSKRIGIDLDALRLLDFGHGDDVQVCVA